MDIAGLSTTLAMNRTSQAVSVAMLSKTMETSENAGAGLIQMIDTQAMERSVNPTVGSNFDVSV